MRPVVALGLGVLVVLAGCGDVTVAIDDSSPTPSLTQSPTHTPPPSPTSRSTGTQVDSEAGPQVAATTIDGDSLSFTVRPSSDTARRTLTLDVRADTTLASTADWGTPGEPVFVVSIDGETVKRTDEVEISRRVSVPITLSRRTLAPHSGDTVVLKVSLVDEDLVSDDYLAGTEGRITLPNVGTSTPTATGTPRPSGTPHAPTATVTPDPASTPPTTVASSPSETPSPSPTATPGHEQRSEWVVTVVEVVDGDTFEVRFENGSTETVRLLGVDTPETNTETSPDEWEGIPDTESGHQWLRDWGHEATEHAKTTVGGEEIRIETDEEADRRGSYDRLLVYAYHDGGQLFNEELLTDGFARFYDTQFTKRDEFAAHEDDAQTNDIGVWDYESQSTATPTPTPRPDGGGTEPLAVKTIHYDADGNDHDNLNDEYVVFENTGDAPLELSGWTVTDEDDKHAYEFPEISLAPGETVTLYTGSGSDSNSEVYWGENQAVWNNDGDVVHVTDDVGETVTRESYEGNS